MTLELNDVIWERDENGELIPQEVELIEEINGKKDTILCIPLTRGERKKLVLGLDIKGNTNKDTDKELVLKYCVKPKFDEKNIEDTPFGIVEAIAATILSASGLPIGKNKTVKQANAELEDDFQDASKK